jgi:aminopeptidase N
MLLCVKKDNKPLSEFIYQYYHAPLYLDKYEALQKAGSSYSADFETAKMVEDALVNAFSGIRLLAIKNIGTLAKNKKEEIKAKLIQLAKSDEKAAVRAEAVKALSKYFKDDDLKTLFREKTKDRSYDVATEALAALTVLSSDEGLRLAAELENDSSSYVLTVVADIYAEYGGRKDNDFFQNIYSRIKPDYRYQLLLSYGAYLRKADLDITSGGINFLSDKARHAEPWLLRLAAMHSLLAIKETLASKSEKPATSLEDKRDSEDMKKVLESLTATIADIRKNESNKRLRRIYDLQN